MKRRGRPRSPGILTPRENDVVRLAAANLTNREIAERLGISEQGVRYHLTQVYQKLLLDSREQLVEWYRSEHRAVHRAFALPLGLLPTGRAVSLPVLAKGTALAMGGLALAGMTFVAFSLRSDEAPPAEAEVVRVQSPTPTPVPGEDCTIDTPLLDTSLPARCLPDLATLKAAVPFELISPPDARGYTVNQLALGDSADGPLAFLRYDTPDGRLDLLQGEFERERGLAGAGQPPLVVTNPLTGEAANGFFEPAPGSALSRLWWCPTGPSRPDCTGVMAGLHGLPQADLELLVLEMASASSPGGVVAPGTPVPFPEPLGERVEPLVAGIPDYPDAAEVDGFMTTGRGNGPETAQAAQVFETSDFPEQVFTWFDQELIAAGWSNYHGGSGVAGKAASYTRNGETEWVTISTYYTPRPGKARPEPPPGFRGKGIPFNLHQDGKTRFWVVTWVQP